MSVQMSIFFTSPGTLDAATAELQSLLGIRLELVPDAEEPRYEYQGLGIELVCFSAAGFEDSVGIPFSRYSFVLNVIPVRVQDAEGHWWELMYHCAMYCFERITHVLGWPSIAVLDLQQVEARFDGQVRS